MEGVDGMRWNGKYRWDLWVDIDMMDLMNGIGGVRYR